MLGHGARILLINLLRRDPHIFQHGLDAGVAHQLHEGGQADTGAHHIGGEGAPETVRVGKTNEGSPKALARLLAM